jgi:ATP-dependent Clp protease ATP-binding subunit ClpA
MSKQRHQVSEAGPLARLARSVLEFGRQEADRLNHNYLGTEHVLLALMREPNSAAAKVLNNLGIDLEKVRQAVEGIIGRGERPAGGEIPLTPRAKKVMELALEEAHRLKHHDVKAEHLLLGLAREGEGVAAKVLESFGVSRDLVRDQVVSLLKKDSVVTCRVNHQDLEAIDMLTEVGICSTRSEAASWLIRAGIEANQALFEKVKGTISDIRRLRQEAQASARQLGCADQPPAEPPPQGPLP